MGESLKAGEMSSGAIGGFKRRRATVNRRRPRCRRGEHHVSTPSPHCGTN